MRGMGIKSYFAIIVGILIITSTSGHCKLSSFCDFRDTTFTGPVDADYWQRSWRFGFPAGKIGLSDKIRFYFSMLFNNATFDSAAKFSSASFNSTANFSDATFNSLAEFSDATFDSTADYFSANFKSTTDFSLANFHSTADFMYTTFDSTADFSMANFYSTADFRNATFDVTAFFLETRFVSIADFRFAEFRDRVLFKPNTLPEFLDMRHVTQIAKPIDMTYSGKARSGERCKIALTKADVSKIWINMELFEVWFPADTSYRASCIWHDTTIKSTYLPINNNRFLEYEYKTMYAIGDTMFVRVHTPSFDSQLYKFEYDTLYSKCDMIVDTTISPSYDDQLAVYEGVLKQFENRGRKESYEILDKEYRHFVNRHKGGIYKGIDWFQSLWWGYGYNPERVFGITLGLWLLFTIINLKFYRCLNENVYAVSFLGSRRRPIFGRPKTWMRYLLQTLAYTAVVFFGLKMSLDKFRKGIIKDHPVLFSYLMIVYVSGLVCFGFIVNIIFTK